MATQVKTYTPAQIYGEAGLIYIRYHATIENKPNGQKKIGGSRPAFSKIQKQVQYKPTDGKYYSLLMGREFKPGRWSILLDFDNKADESSKSGLELMEKLNMNQYKAPTQTTPSGGYHYIFYVDEQQKDQITSKTTITYEGVKYNMDVKFKNSLCNCAPSKIEGYGAYRWVRAARLREIPKLPDELFEMITHRATPPSTPAISPVITPRTETASEQEPTTATDKQLQDIKDLCSCLSIAQLDDYSTWIRIGMILKKLGAPLSLWEEVSK